jgi:hypothetical protein
VTHLSDSGSWTGPREGTSRDCFSRKAVASNAADALGPAAAVAYARWRIVGVTARYRPNGKRFSAGTGLLFSLRLR